MHAVVCCSTFVCVSSITLLNGLLDFLGVFGEIQVSHVCLEVVNRALTSSHAESLYRQICKRGISILPLNYCLLQYNFLVHCAVLNDGCFSQRHTSASLIGQYTFSSTSVVNI